jgi:CspA family cold shock protein
MGKYRNHREPRRRGFDNEPDFASDRDAEPIYFRRPPPSASPPPHTASSVVDAEVMWFNPTKGFGFVKAQDGSEAFLHISSLEGAGCSSVCEGTRLKVRIEQGQKGPQVVQVLEVSGETASPTGQRPARPAPHRPGPDEGTDEVEGTVKWYNPDKGFGFISPAGGGKDIFVHASVVTRSGIAALSEGQKVVVRYAVGQKGPEARVVRLA